MHRYQRTESHFGWGRGRLVAVGLAMVVLQVAPVVAAEAEDTRAGGSDSSSNERSGADLVPSKGAFAKLWNEQWFVGPGTFEFRQTRGETAKTRLPADFEGHEAIVLAGGWLAREAPGVLAQVVRHAAKSTRVVLLVSSPREQEFVVRRLAERGLQVDGGDFLLVATDTGWVRDFGPVFVWGGSGGLEAFDAAYDMVGRSADDGAGRLIARAFGATPIETRLRWQGGNVLSNGKGLVVTTTQSINANIECGHELKTITSFLEARFGVSHLVVLEHLQGEKTGHADMFACFVSADTVVVGACDESTDPANAAVLDRNAARLSAVETGGGKLKVVRIPMPAGRDDFWRSYTNVVFAGKTVIVPLYPDVDRKGGEETLRVYRQLLPERDVIGIDASELGKHQGGLRCLTLYVPKS